MRPLPLLVALVLGVASAFAVACGGSGDRSNLIPAGAAGDLTSALDAVSAATKAGNCTAAGQAVSRARGVLVQLSPKVDRRLRQRLASGLRNLSKRVPVDCQKTTSTPSSSPSAPETVTPTQPTPTQTPPTTTTPTQTQTPPTTTTPTPTTTTPPPTTTPGDTTGGTGVIP